MLYVRPSAPSGDAPWRPQSGLPQRLDLWLGQSLIDVSTALRGLGCSLEDELERRSKIDKGVGAERLTRRTGAAHGHPCKRCRVLIITLKSSPLLKGG